MISGSRFQGLLVGCRVRSCLMKERSTREGDDPLGDNLPGEGDCSLEEEEVGPQVGRSTPRAGEWVRLMRFVLCV